MARANGGRAEIGEARPLWPAADSIHRLAAEDGEDGAGDVAGHRRGGEEHVGRRQLFRLGRRSRELEETTRGIKKHLHSGWPDPTG